MTLEREPDNRDPDAVWLREFADAYRNGTLKDVNPETQRLLEIAAKLEARQ